MTHQTKREADVPAGKLLNRLAEVKMQTINNTLAKVPVG